MNTQKAWHHLTGDTVVTELESDLNNGLNLAKVKQRQHEFGPNSITGQQSIPAWKRLLLQFHNPLIYILIFATLVTFFLKEYVDSGVIFAVVLINAVIGFIQESKAEEAINSLKKMLSSSATVLRDGQKTSIPAEELVPGDIVFLASGDKVPADMRLVTCNDMQIDESALTGESVASEKSLQQLSEDTVLADRNNMAFAGTLVTYGGGTGIGTQRECLELLDCYGRDRVYKFAEIVASVVLAGEISLASAISSSDWVSSHEQYGRNR